MSFMERRISEYKTAPDVRRGSKGGERRPFILSRSISRSAVSGVPVKERKKMFEQSESSNLTTSSGYGSVSSRRGNKQQKKDLSRNSSFRGTKKLKSEDAHSPVLGRSRQLGSSNTSFPLWKRLRNFGHFDVQSLSMDSLSVHSNNIETEHNVKKPTGASAARGDAGSEEKGGISNSLVCCCPSFTNEIGGDRDWLTLGNPVLELRDCLSVDKQRRVASRERMILDGDIPTAQRGPTNRQVSEILSQKTGISYPFEFIDFGASYYRNYFLHHEHQNFFGIDENLGPVAISIRREKVSSDQLGKFHSLQPIPGQLPPKHLYRVIFRTSEQCTLRGTLLEESIPTGAKTGTSKGIPPRDIVEYITQGEVQMSCLKLGKNEKKVLQELVRLDEQELNNKYKIGIIYCKPGQTTEEDMYNNESGSPAFDEFLEVIGKKVRMKGFNKYRAQLDSKTDTTGEFSIYTEFKDTEVMFHVSTLLPHTTSNRQQLLRKRHIGNDIVTVIFQEPGCEQFSPRWIRSHFQHIFVIVGVENPNTKFTKYRIAVSRSTDIPYFGPHIPEGAVFDKDENFKDFLLTKLINACNASLRNQKFSTMAVRTRKQYLNDLAEQSSTSITIDQANTSGRVAGLLRNLGHKKRERMRQDSTLIYTGGALTWHVSILLRNKKPLPFSEEQDNHIDCIMGIGPDIMIFVDYHTKDTLLHIPMKDLSGWITDNNRMNLFYENSFCLSIECLESEDDLREMVTRMQTLAPKLTASHEASSMEFRRSSAGFLGFTINEAGVVEKVDGLARNSGLQPSSRLLQVEDRLLCCHTHKQITDLLTAKDKLVVKAYVIPPSPEGREVLFYPEINWSAIWMSRPSHADAEESTKVQNDVEKSETVQNSNKITDIQLRKKASHIKSYSTTNRYSYLEAMQSSEIERSHVGPDMMMMIDDDEPIYDRLTEKDDMTHQHQQKPKSPQSSRKLDSAHFRRVKGQNKVTRESVMQLADDMKGRKNRLPVYVPKGVEHEVTELEMPAQITSSVEVMEHKPHQAAPLVPHHRRSSSKDLKIKRPVVEVTSPLTPLGTVSKMKERFMFNSPPSSTGHLSKIPTVRPGNSPMRALASTSEMTKSSIPVKVRAYDSKVPLNDSVMNSEPNNVQFRSVNNMRSRKKTRPASFDVSLLLNNERNVIETSKDDSMVHGDIVFNRNTNVKSAFHKKSQSRELSPEYAEDDVKAMESKPFSEPVPRSPTTGALISGEENEILSGEISEFNEISALCAEEKKLSQNTGSQSSQDSIRNPQLTVRERTQRWEARGGGVPSYFSTLPKSFRHKTNDRHRDSADVSYPQSPTGESPISYVINEEETTPRKHSYVSRTSSSTRGSLSGIPLPTSRLRSSHSPTPAAMGSQGAAADKSRSPAKEELSNPYDVKRNLRRSPTSESSLEQRMGVAQDDDDEQQSRGNRKGSSSMIPTRNMQVSSKRTGQPVARNRDGMTSPTSESGGSDSLKHGRSSSSGQPPRHSSIPLKVPTSRSLQNSSGTNATTSIKASQNLERKVSESSLDENFKELDRDLTELLKQEERKRPMKRGNSHIEEWIRQTSKDAVPPDMLGDNERNIYSPTLTDKSLSYTQTEPGNNSELHSKLKATEDNRRLERGLPV